MSREAQGAKQSSYTYNTTMLKNNTAATCYNIKQLKPV